MGKWRTVLVGVDGSYPSRTALSWAAAEAEEHQADLVVLKVWERTVPPPLGRGTVSPKELPESAEDATEELLQDIRDELGENPSVLVQPRVVQGNPAQVLIEESQDVDLLVVGTRGRGGFAGLVLGSVSQHVAAYAKCPVTVVR